VEKNVLLWKCFRFCLKTGLYGSILRSVDNLWGSCPKGRRDVAGYRGRVLSDPSASNAPKGPVFNA
jgi:hypothetical protein